MKQYLLSIYQPDEGVPPPEILEKVMRNLDALNHELEAAGAWVFAGGLHPPSTATVLRPHAGDVLTIDGPFAEGKEHLGGFNVQDAFTAAVQRWPSTGLPPSPAGWIITTARNRAIDRLRREASRDDRHAQATLLHARDEPTEKGPVRDDRLRLIFTCCHPALAPGAQIALTLRLLGGLTTTEIAHAFLVRGASVGKSSGSRSGSAFSGAKLYSVPQLLVGVNDGRSRRRDNACDRVPPHQFGHDVGVEDDRTSASIERPSSRPEHAARPSTRHQSPGLSESPSAHSRRSRCLHC